MFFFFQFYTRQLAFFFFLRLFLFFYWMCVLFNVVFQPLSSLWRRRLVEFGIGHSSFSGCDIWHSAFFFVSSFPSCSPPFVVCVCYVMPCVFDWPYWHPWNTFSLLYFFRGSPFEYLIYFLLLYLVKYIYYTNIYYPIWIQSTTRFFSYGYMQK